MKPRFLCTSCGAEIKWGERSCASCGKPIDWPSDVPAEDSADDAAKPPVCGKCGAENAAGASFCSTCGAKLHGVKNEGGKRQAKASGQAARQGKGRDSRKGGSEASPLFSWKVISGFLGLLLLLVVGVELFSTREQAPVQQQAATPQPQAANLQLTNQISALEAQVAANPADMQTVLKLANMCQDGRFFDKAIVYYKKFLEKNVKDADARVDLGICYFEAGDLDEAQKQMLEALKYDPKHLQAHFNLGIVNLRARRIKEANEWFKKTIALAPPNSEISQQAKQFLEQHSSPLIQNQ